MERHILLLLVSCVSSSRPMLPHQEVMAQYIPELCITGFYASKWFRIAYYFAALLMLYCTYIYSSLHPYHIDEPGYQHESAI